jgi:hypothetical protein
MRLRYVRRWAALTCSATVGAASVGVSSASTSTGTRVVVAKYGFAVTLPAGWQKVQLTKSGISKLVKRMHKVAPVQGFLSSRAAQETVRRMQLYAIGPLQGGMVPNMNVLVQSPPGLPRGASFLSQVKQLMTGTLHNAGFTNVTTTVVHLPFGSAVQGQYTAPSSSVVLTQLYISHRSHFYIVTFTPSSVATQIENTWRWQ